MSEVESNEIQPSQRHHAAWILLAAVGLFAALAAPLLAHRVYTLDDLGGYHLPLRAFYAEQLVRGEPFDWMPSLNCGLYLTGEGQLGGYHPWHRFLYRWLPLQAAMGSELLASYVMIFAGVWLWLRRRLERSDAAALGALIFTFSSFNLLHFVHPNAIGVIAHIPWLLWAMDIAVVDASRRKVAAALAAIALLTGSQILLGYPQYVWFSLVAEAAYGGLLLFQRRYRAREGCVAGVACARCIGGRTSPWPSLVIAKLLGLLVGGVQLLPTLDAMLASTRHAADSEFVNIGSLHPLNLVQLVGPYLFTDRVLGGNTHELGIYLGAVPLMLVAWLLIRRRNLDSLAPLARAVGGFAIVMLLLAMGQYGQLYRLQHYLPLIGQFRCPCRYLVLFQLSVALLSAIGFMLLDRDRRAAGREVRGDTTKGSHDVLAAIVLFSVAIAVAGIVFGDRFFFAPWPRVLAGPLLIGTAAALVAATARGVRGAMPALILLAAADLGSYGLSYSVYGQTERIESYVAEIESPPSTERGEDNRYFAPPEMVDGAKLWHGNQLTLAGWWRTDGYTGLEPQRNLDYFQTASLRVASTRWAVADRATTAIAGLVPRGKGWLEVPAPLPRVRLVSQVIASTRPAEDLLAIDVERAALCEQALALPPGRQGVADLSVDRPGHLEISATCPSPQFLVVAESFHDGWRATVDGSPRTVFRTNGDFLGLVVAPGETSVVLHFEPASLRRGKLASWMGLCLVAGCFASVMVRRRTRDSENEA